MQGSGVDAEATTALQTLRGTLIPATVGGYPRRRGRGRTDRDRVRLEPADGRRRPLGLRVRPDPGVPPDAVTFRSVVIAIKAVLLNLLSVAAAYGALVLVFQHGWGKSLLGFEKTGGIAGFLPMFLFVILFGLSMDYHVFILTRIREAYDGGMSTENAVAHGIRTCPAAVIPKVGAAERAAQRAPSPPGSTRNTASPPGSWCSVAACGSAFPRKSTTRSAITASHRDRQDARLNSGFAGKQQAERQHHAVVAVSGASARSARLHLFQSATKSRIEPTYLCGRRRGTLAATLGAEPKTWLTRQILPAICQASPGSPIILM